MRGAVVQQHPLVSFAAPVGGAAGEGGFEPPNGGSKGRCLTTWRLPNTVDAKLLMIRVVAIIPPGSSIAMTLGCAES
jgi:hypothetical protein